MDIDTSALIAAFQASNTSPRARRQARQKLRSVNDNEITNDDPDAVTVTATGLQSPVESDRGEHVDREKSRCLESDRDVRSAYGSGIAGDMAVGTTDLQAIASSTANGRVAERRRGSRAEALSTAADVGEAKTRGKKAGEPDSAAVAEQDSGYHTTGNSPSTEYGRSLGGQRNVNEMKSTPRQDLVTGGSDRRGGAGRRRERRRCGRRRRRAVSGGSLVVVAFRHRH